MKAKIKICSDGVPMLTTKNGVNYSIDFKLFKRCWCNVWLPKWHKGRGKYITVGFYFVRFCRGY